MPPRRINKDREHRIEKEVNTAKNFANLRQIFYSMVLATWYKQNLKGAFLNQVYADKGKINGVDAADKAVKWKIYRQYLQAYKKGVFNYIKEDKSPNSFGPNPADQPIVRKYFSGGLMDMAKAHVVGRDDPDVAAIAAGLKPASDGVMLVATVDIQKTPDPAMLDDTDQALKEKIMGVEVRVSPHGSIMVGEDIYKKYPQPISQLIAQFIGIYDMFQEYLEVYKEPKRITRIPERFQPLIPYIQLYNKLGFSAPQMPFEVFTARKMFLELVPYYYGPSAQAKIASLPAPAQPAVKHKGHNSKVLEGPPPEQWVSELENSGLLGTDQTNIYSKQINAAGIFLRKKYHQNIGPVSIRLTHVDRENIGITAVDRGRMKLVVSEDQLWNRYVKAGEDKVTELLIFALFNGTYEEKHVAEFEYLEQEWGLVI